jgi:hypothetical protein
MNKLCLDRLIYVYDACEVLFKYLKIIWSYLHYFKGFMVDNGWEFGERKPKISYGWSRDMTSMARF